MRTDVQYMTDSELLALVLKSGSRHKTAKDLANDLLNQGDLGLRFIEEATMDELCSIDGIGRVKALHIKAAVELGRRIACIHPERFIISSTDVVFKYYSEIMRTQKQEVFKVLALNTKNEVIGEKDVYIGTINTISVSPREVFKFAIDKCANKIMLLHNHPSGNCTPSYDDDKFTEKLVEVGKLVEIPVLDHLVFGDGDYFSYREYNKI